MTEQSIHDEQLQDEPLEEGLELILEQVEELVPPVVRAQVARRPLTFVLLGLGIGIILGAKKGDELLRAGTGMLTSALMANFSSRLGGDPGDQ